MPAKLVSEYMTTNVAILQEANTLRDAVELELTHGVRHIPILNAQGRLAGVVTDRDIKRALPTPLSATAAQEYEAILDATPIARVMTRAPLTVEPDEPLVEAVRLMLSRKIGGLPVVEEGVVVGVFTRTDALHAYLDLLDATRD